MADYTERFSEVAAVLGVVNPQTIAAEVNSGYVSLANYHRAAIVIHAGTITGDIDVDVEEGTSTAGAGAQGFGNGTTKDIALVATTDDNTVSIIEIRTEEFSNGYDCVNLEMTSTTAVASAIIYGLVPRFAPVPTTNVDSVTD